ncbi:MAG: acetylxylan esterase [Phycisphaerales bacterium JB063]
MTLPTLIVFAVALLASTGFAWVIHPSYDESSVPEFVLPDPLVSADGTPITTEEQWPARRAELLECFRDQMFGRLGEVTRAADVRFERIESDSAALDGKATRRQVRIHFTHQGDGLSMDLLLYLPNDAAGPVPVFVGMNFDGNHTVHDDPAILLPRSWVRDSDTLGVANHQASEAGRGARKSRWPIETILARGYGIATVYYGELDPDFDDGLGNGVHGLAPPEDESDRPGDAGGAIAAWAWGYSRALDYMATDDAVDAARVIAMGHSRLGKAALWAGANDERFAMVVSNNSGCGGAALSRRRFGETIYAINSRFPHWFCSNFHAYNDNETELPFDQHELLALIAPRPVYVASAQDDRWADPRGEFLACVHASPVYELLGVDGLKTDTMPAVNAPQHEGRVGYHLRTGGHDVTAYDWQQYLDFADRHVKGQVDE